MRISEELGDIFILPDVFTTISGYTASSCFGVKGMAERGVADGIIRLLRRDSLSKGVKVTFLEGKKVSVELHIAVEQGVNMPAVSESIVDAIRYNVEQQTSVPVQQIQVFVDSVHAEP
jgi:uncharacterized alkaline shock family protein YloU